MAHITSSVSRGERTAPGGSPLKPSHLFGRAKIQLFMAGLFLFITACTPASPSATSTPTYISELTCDQVIVFANVSCIETSSGGLLLQTLDAEQVTLQTISLNITFDSTIYWHIPDGFMAIATIEGVTVVGGNGVTKVVYAGTEVHINKLSQPSEMNPYTLEAEIENELLLQLPRAIDLSAPKPTLAPTVTPTPLPTLTPTPEPCNSREDWTYLYTVQRGDNLSNIAQRHEITVQELQRGNCLLDPNTLHVGDTLRVPLLAEADITSTPIPRVVYYADSMTIKDGECTRLFWEVIGAQVVYFEGVATSHSDTRNVCPREDATYTIRIIFLDGSQQDYQVEISVE